VLILTVIEWLKNTMKNSILFSAIHIRSRFNFYDVVVFGAQTGAIVVIDWP